MTTLIQSTFSPEEQRVILPSVTWQQYESLLATLGDYPGLRLIYLEGTLEIFMPSPEHDNDQEGDCQAARALCRRG
jgi:Uma2 family endonuclease